MVSHIIFRAGGGDGHIWVDGFHRVYDHRTDCAERRKRHKALEMKDEYSWLTELSSWMLMSFPTEWRSNLQTEGDRDQSQGIKY